MKGQISRRMGPSASPSTQRLSPLLSFLAAALVLLAPGLIGSAQAADNPQLLPDHPTPVIDLARTLSEGQRRGLEEELSGFEAANGWKLRVLTQYERTPGLAVKDFWQLDERSLLLVADPRGGNLLNFNVGDALFALMPRTFWVELQTRFGNQYYVRDHGEDGAIIDALAAVETCLERGGCQVVPGLPQEQWILTFCSSVLGGLVVGIAAYPRQPGVRVAWAWVLPLAPLWGILFIALGLGPVLTRTDDLLPVLRNGLGFLGSAVLAYVIAQRTVGDSRPSENES